MVAQDIYFQKDRMTDGDTNASLTDGERFRPDFWPGSADRETESTAPIVLGTDTHKSRDGWSRDEDTIALDIANREGGI